MSQKPETPGRHTPASLNTCDIDDANETVTGDVDTSARHPNAVPLLMVHPTAPTVDDAIAGLEGVKAFMDDIAWCHAATQLDLLLGAQGAEEWEIWANESTPNDPVQQRETDLRIHAGILEAEEARRKSELAERAGIESEQQYNTDYLERQVAEGEPAGADPETGEVSTPSTALVPIPKDPVTGEELPLGSHIYRSKEGNEFTDADWIDDAIWQSSPVMRQLHETALLHDCAPDLVLGAVLALVSWLQPVQLRLNDYISTVGNLNFACAQHGLSGKGKTTSFGLAHQLLGLDAHGYPNKSRAPSDAIGTKLRRMGDATGEKIVDNYFLHSKDGKEAATFHYTNLFYECDEGLTILNEMRRNGSKFVSIALKLVSGTNALSDTKGGQKYASGLPVQGYRFSAAINMQQSVAAEFLKHADVGLPQRMVGFQGEVVKFRRKRTPEERRERREYKQRNPVKPLDSLYQVRTDADLTDTRNGLRMRLVTMTDELADQYEELGELIEFDRNEISDEDRRLLAEYGITDSSSDVNGHQLLAHFKVAALVAVLHGTTEVDQLAWHIASEVLRVSARSWQRISQSNNAGTSKRKQAQEIRSDERNEAAEARERAYGRMARWLVKQEPDSVTAPSKLGNKGKPGKCGAVKPGMTAVQLVQMAVDDGVFAVNDSGAYELTEDGRAHAAEVN